MLRPPSSNLTNNSDMFQQASQLNQSLLGKKREKIILPIKMVTAEGPL